MRPSLQPLRSAPAGILWLLAMRALAQDADAPVTAPAAPPGEAEPLGPQPPPTEPPEAASARAASTQPAAAQPSIASAELERRGATIRMINIVVDNVFDPEGNPGRRQGTLPLCDRVHVRSRPEVIENALLFKAGDRDNGRVLDESARALAHAASWRTSGSLSNSTAASNSVDVEVRSTATRGP